MTSEASDYMVSEFLTDLEKHIQSGSINEAEHLIKNNKYEKCVREKCWDIIPVITNYLLQENINNAQLLDCCEVTLKHIAEIANPEEAFLELLQQADSLDNDVKFLALLKPLIIVLDKLPKRREQSLEWCLSVIHTHVAALAVPQNHKLEDDERKLLDTDHNVLRIATVYTGIMPFVKHFVLETVSHQCKQSEGETVCAQHVIMTYSVLKLLGKPLVYLDLEHEQKAKSKVRVLAEELMSFLAELINDLMGFLEYCHPGIQSANWFNREENVPILCIANFYYLLFAEKLQITKAPCVYSPIYLFQKCLCLVVVLMEYAEIFITSKALLLAEALLSRLKEGGVPHFLLDSPVHGDFVQALMRVMVYCEIEQQRKAAVKLLQSYLFKFDTKGRYLLMLNIQQIANHSGVIGYLIMQLKDMVKTNMLSSVSSKYFKGKCLIDLIMKYCSLSNGTETDLVENIDQIVSSLNFIRYLVLRDKHNDTGVWDCIDSLKKRFLEPLREGIILSRAHYQLELKGVQEEKRLAKDSKSEAKSLVTRTIVEQQLLNLPQENKVDILNSALNAFDLMESLLSRVNECIIDTNVNEQVKE